MTLTCKKEQLLSQISFNIIVECEREGKRDRIYKYKTPDIFKKSKNYKNFWQNWNIK